LAKSSILAKLQTKTNVIIINPHKTIMLQFVNSPATKTTTVTVLVVDFGTKTTHNQVFKVELNATEKKDLRVLETMILDAIDANDLELAKVAQNQLLEVLTAKQETNVGNVVSNYEIIVEWPTGIQDVNFVKSVANPDKVFLQVKGIVSALEFSSQLKLWVARAIEVGDVITPIVKFWISLLRNPIVRGEKTTEGAQNRVNAIANYVTATYVDKNLRAEYIEQGYSNEVATDLARVPQTPLTREGLIQAKKVVEVETERMLFKWAYGKDGEVVQTLRDVEGVAETLNEETGEVEVTEPALAEDWLFSPYLIKDGEQFYAGDKLGYEYKVGQIARLESWDSVNTNLNASCVKGLHVGNQDYINSYENDSNVTLDCLVSPMHIGAVSDGENVMRVLQFMPIGIKNRQVANRNLYSSYQYNQVVEAEWKRMAEEAVAVNNEQIKAIVQQTAFINSL
jgi:hypothetical protein